MSTPFLRRITATLSRRDSSTTRASSLFFLAQTSESAEGLIVSRSTMRPSDFETILCLTTRISPGSNARACCRIVCSSLSTSASPCLMSSVKEIGMRRTSLGKSFLGKSFDARGLFLASDLRVAGLLTDHPYLRRENDRRWSSGGPVAGCGFRQAAQEVAADLRGCLRQARCWEVAAPGKVFLCLEPRQGAA